MWWKMAKTRNYTIDLLRLIMALFIVALHSNPFAEYNAFISYFPSQVLSRLGVPFFAAVAGYYFFSEEISNKRVWASIKKYLSVYTIWSSIMISYQLISQIGGVLQKAYWATYLGHIFSRGIITCGMCWRLFIRWWLFAWWVNFHVVLRRWMVCPEHCSWSVCFALGMEICFLGCQLSVIP